MFKYFEEDNNVKLYLDFVNRYQTIIFSEISLQHLEKAFDILENELNILIILYLSVDNKEVKMQKPEYIIMNDGGGFALYRKLFPGEYVWYRKELYRLRIYEKKIWLKLETDKNKEVLVTKLKKMNA